jgi:hypothetical protein
MPKGWVTCRGGDGFGWVGGTAILILRGGEGITFSHPVGSHPVGFSGLNKRATGGLVLEIHQFDSNHSELRNIRISICAVDTSNVGR